MFFSSVVVDMGSIQQLGSGQLAGGAGAIAQPAHGLTVFRPDGATSESGTAAAATTAAQPALLRPERPVALDTAASTTLAKFYRERFLPEYLTAIKRVKADTISLYENAIAWWERLTGDPALAAIDDALCSQFVAALMQSPGRRDEFLSLLTVKKHCRNLQAILTRCGPKIAGVKWCQKLIDEVPTFEVPAWRGEPANQDFTPAELRAVLASVKCANTPRDADPPTWWRAFVLFAYHTGLRIGAMMRVRWEHFEADGWLRVPNAISKRGAGIRLWIHPDALAAITLLAPGDKSGPILPWKSIDGHGINNLRGRWRYLLAKAGIPKHRQFGFHGIRKTTAMAVRAIDRDAADIILGHATSIRMISYSDRARILAEACAKMERLVA